MSKNDATILVECDGCSDAVYIELQATARGTWSDGLVQWELMDTGWASIGESDFCKDCLRADDGAIQELIEEAQRNIERED